MVANCPAVVLSQNSRLACSTKSLQRQMLAGEGAKCCVKMAHQHGSRHALAGNIAQQKQESRRNSIRSQ